MPDDFPAELDALDNLDNLTLGQIRRLTNPAIRQVLYDLAQAELVRPEHTSHAEHSNHHKASFRLDPIVEEPR